MIIRLSILLVLLFNLAFADSFQTALGECNLEIYGGRVEDIPEIVQIIKVETENLTTEYGKVELRPYSVYITANMDDFYEKSKGPVPEWGIAVAKLNPDRIILKSPGIANISFSRMKEVIIHELNHIYLHRIPGHFTFPSWFLEGMAMKSAHEFSLLHKIEISKAHWQDQIIPLNGLKHISRFKRGKVKRGYAESAAAIEALVYYYGDDVPVSVLTAMRNGKEFPEALEVAIGEEMIEFQIKFEIYLEENFNLLIFLKASKYIFVILPVILVGGFIYKKYKNKEILERWEAEEVLEDSEWENELPN